MTTSTPSTGLSAGRLKLEYPKSLGVFAEYLEAQRLVDYLADHDFPVQDVMIVGTDLKQFERVTGRLTMGRVAAAGALSGAWMGLFVGILLWVFTANGSFVAQVGLAVLIGAVFGVVWAAIGFAASRGQRDFASVTQVVPTQYEVLVEHKHLARGQELRTQLDPGAAAYAAPSAPQTLDPNPPVAPNPPAGPPPTTFPPAGPPPSSNVPPVGPPVGPGPGSPEQR